jgi:prephenate dehydrogenase
MSKPTVNLALIGLNQITGSLGLALREFSQQPKAHLHFTVTGYDESKEVLKQAKQMGAVDETNNKLKALVQEAQIIVVGVAPGKLENTYREFGLSLRPGAVVLDLSPYKRQCIDLAKKYFIRNEERKPRAYVVGIYPLVNNKYLYDPRAGLEAATAGLFTKSEMVIAPDAACPAEAVKLASDLAGILQMDARFLDPEECDGILELTETLPKLIGVLMFSALQGSSGRRDLERTVNPAYANLLHGLRELSAEDLTMIWSANLPQTLGRLDTLIGALQNLRQTLAQTDEKTAHTLAKEMVDGLEDWENRRLNRTWDQALAMPAFRASSLASMLGFSALENALQKIEKRVEEKK